MSKFILQLFHAFVDRTFRNSLRGIVVFKVLLLLAVSANANAQMFQPLSEVEKQRDRFLMAARVNDAPKIKKMIEQGVNPNLFEPARGETALMLAVREDAYKVFEFLISHPETDLNLRATNGDTALMLAAYLGKVDWVAELINAGAQVNQTGWTALHYAAAIGDEQIIAVLLEHHAYIDAESPNKTTPLMMAARKGELPAVKLLVQEGADLQLTNMLGLTALDFARDAGMSEVARFLSEKRASKP
ncbi:MAG: ankyrin repeat domain-containing protein [Burkholderiaceae bacterium]|nr:MAG: ankyrin repeat domain-containing protein [Burkholderiaceae bacterium]